MACLHRKSVNLTGACGTINQKLILSEEVRGGYASAKEKYVDRHWSRIVHDCDLCRPLRRSDGERFRRPIRCDPAGRGRHHYRASANAVVLGQVSACLPVYCIRPRLTQAKSRHHRGLESMTPQMVPHLGECSSHRIPKVNLTMGGGPILCRCGPPLVSSSISIVCSPYSCITCRTSGYDLPRTRSRDQSSVAILRLKVFDASIWERSTYGDRYQPLPMRYHTEPIRSLARVSARTIDG